MTPKWEYLSDSIMPDRNGSAVERWRGFGDAGWELVAVCGETAYFKRVAQWVGMTDDEVVDMNWEFKATRIVPLAPWNNHEVTTIINADALDRLLEDLAQDAGNVGMGALMTLRDAAKAMEAE